ncbi:hypothetical protein [Ruania alba]|uniref:Uncharacterized protein n=1 Tax=Ruania alba TaxID=648782 RepID=A0A1H5N729_9MICO|nr:hypothetical protein [Ruania alba]SEE97415.1 hypothetical protein SAMN04488554_4019 [Ruania alba]
MQTTHTSVLARRVWIRGPHATLPYEAGWATEALFFTQVEGDHPELTISTEISPDGITWVPWGEPVTLAEPDAIAATALTRFGSWVRLVLTGASESRPARVLVHISLKG